MSLFPSGTLLPRLTDVYRVITTCHWYQVCFPSPFKCFHLKMSFLLTCKYISRYSSEIVTTVSVMHLLHSSQNPVLRYYIIRFIVGTRQKTKVCYGRSNIKYNVTYLWSLFVWSEIIFVNVILWKYVYLNLVSIQKETVLSGGSGVQ